jgi:ribonuclease HI
MRHTFRVDASYDARLGVTGIGLVLHRRSDCGRRDGELIAAVCEAYLDVPAGLGEKFAILRALEIAKEMTLPDVKIRSDCNRMRTELHRDHRARTGQDRDDLHGLILRLALAFQRVHFAWVPRHKNQQAHRLARQAARSLPPRARSDNSLWGSPRSRKF